MRLCAQRELVRSMLALTREMPWMWAALLVLVVLPAFIACYYVLCLRSYAAASSASASAPSVHFDSDYDEAEAEAVVEAADDEDAVGVGEEDGAERPASCGAAQQPARAHSHESESENENENENEKMHMHLHGQHRCGTVRTRAADRVRLSCNDCAAYIRRTRAVHAEQTPAGGDSALKSPSLDSN